MIASFAICGFANFGSVAIQLGAFSQMLPERRSEFAGMGILSMVGGALASCLSACWASLFF
jgi:concentrative nucleoside transporter, CNT family